MVVAPPAMRSPHPQLLRVNHKASPSHHDHDHHHESSSSSMKKAAAFASKSTTATKSSKNINNKNKEARSIRFNEVVSVRAIKHIDNMTDEEIDSIWFHKQDFQEFKANFIPTLRLMAHGKYVASLSEQEHCSRGLEFRLKSGAQKRKLNKINALCAVLDEQERQRLAGFNSDESLSGCYQNANAHCRKQAHILGVQDAHAARLIHEEEHELSLSLLSEEDSDVHMRDVSSSGGGGEHQHSDGGAATATECERTAKKKKRTKKALKEFFKKKK